MSDEREYNDERATVHDAQDREKLRSFRRAPVCTECDGTMVGQLHPSLCKRCEAIDLLRSDGTIVKPDVVAGGLVEVVTAEDHKRAVPEDCGRCFEAGCDQCMCAVCQDGAPKVCVTCYERDVRMARDEGFGAGVEADARSRAQMSELADIGRRLQEWIPAVDIARNSAEALIAIVGQPWRQECSQDGEEWSNCPHCLLDVEVNGHAPDCAWLIAARALGIAD